MHTFKFTAHACSLPNKPIHFFNFAQSFYMQPLSFLIKTRSFKHFPQPLIIFPVNFLHPPLNCSILPHLWFLKSNSIFFSPPNIAMHTFKFTAHACRLPNKPIHLFNFTQSFYMQPLSFLIKTRSLKHFPQPLTTSPVNFLHSPLNCSILPHLLLLKSNSIFIFPPNIAMHTLKFTAHACSLPNKPIHLFNLTQSFYMQPLSFLIKTRSLKHFPQSLTTST